MKVGKFVAIVVLTALILPPVFAVEASEPGAAERKPSANNLMDKPFPPLKVGKWLTGEPNRIRKVTVLFFWRSDSPGCGHDLIARLNGWQDQWRNDLAVVALNSEPADVQRAFLEATNMMAFAIATDPDNAMSSVLSPRSLPYVLILDSDGVVRYQCDADFLAKSAIGDPAAPSALIIRQILMADHGVAARHMDVLAAAEPLDRPRRDPVGRAAPHGEDIGAKALVGKPFPELKVGKWLTAEPDRAHKVTLIDFWGVHCGPCIRNMPELNEIQAKFKDDLVVVGLNPEPVEAQRTFMAEHAMAYSVGTDSDRIGMSLELRGIPYVFIVGTDGMVRWQGIPGDVDHPLAEEVARIIAADPGVAARHNPPSEHPVRGSKRDK